MNPNLVKLSQQLRAVWRQLGFAQRLSIVMATGLVGAGLLGLAWWSSRQEYGLLYGRLSDSEAAKVIGALDDAKVPYHIGHGGSSISVPSDKVYAMRMQLAGRGIPRGEGVGFEIFDKPNFGISDFVQRANYVRAVQGELARTISQLDEIESARVMIVLPENRLLLDRDKHPTASVFVRVRGNGQLPPQAVNAIRFLVANAVEGLKPNFVSIVDNQGNALSENVEDDSMVGLTATQLAARRNLEQYLAKKTEGMLEKVLGPGQAIVRVAAELNFDTMSRVEEKYDPDGQVVRTQVKNDESDDTTTGNSGGTVGMSANASADTNTTASASPGTNTRNKRTTGNVEYDNSKTTSNYTQVAGSLKRLSAAVTVAAQFSGAGAARKLAPRAPEELEKLRRIVQSALGSDTTRGDQITLEELPFNDQFATEVTAQLVEQQRHEFWWNLARSLLYPALGLFVLGGFWLLLRHTRVEDIPIGMPLGSLASNLRPHGNGNGNGNGHGLSLTDWGQNAAGGMVTVEVLNRLIKENPQNVTEAVRQWLGRGNPPPS